MPNKVSALLPATEHLVSDLGQRLKLARLRRRITAQQLAERAGLSVVTLRALERGSSGSTLGAYLAVMQVLGMERDLSKVLADDPLGQHLQDSRLLEPKRPLSAQRSATVSDGLPLSVPSAEHSDRGVDELITSDSLAALLIGSHKGPSRE